jgi:hypothetical protein
MAYGLCQDASCIVRQVQWVVSMASSSVQIVPEIAGLWGRPDDNRPSLEDQMAALRAVVADSRLA